MLDRSKQTKSREQFLHNLSASLHQLAQPLSIIQASLELALLQKETAAPFRNAAESTLLQVRRAVETLCFTSQLTRYQQPAMDTTNVLPSCVLQDVIADLRATLGSAQVKVVFEQSGREHEIQFSPTRLRQLYFYMLQAVQHLSRPGEIVHIQLQAYPRNIKLQISQIPGNTGHETSEESERDSATRALALAESIASCSGAEFVVTHNPLLIGIDFSVHRKGRHPVADKDKLEGGASAQFAGGLR